MARYARFLFLLISSLLALPAQAEGERSPEALGMALVSAYRQADASAIVLLYHYSPARGVSIQRQQSLVKWEWRERMSRHSLVGYRVIDLTVAERQYFMSRNYAGQQPVKKLVVRLSGDAGGTFEEDCYIVTLNGRYFFIPSNSY